jgi:hypothetical protein
VKHNLDRFLWNYLAQQTGTNTSRRCQPNFEYWRPQAVCEADEVRVCIERPSFS